METRSNSGQTERQRWKEQNREDTIHALEEVWCLDLEDNFHQIFHKHSIMGIEPILQFPKE